MRPSIRALLLTSLAVLTVAGLMLIRLRRRQHLGWHAALTKKRDPVTEASEESFPASDPPSWSPTRAGAPM